MRLWPGGAARTGLPARCRPVAPAQGEHHHVARLPDRRAAHVADRHDVGVAALVESLASGRAEIVERLDLVMVVPG